MPEMGYNSRLNNVCDQDDTSSQQNRLLHDMDSACEPEPTHTVQVGPACKQNETSAITCSRCVDVVSPGVLGLLSGSVLTL